MRHPRFVNGAAAAVARDGGRGAGRAGAGIGTGCQYWAVATAGNVSALSARRDWRMFMPHSITSKLNGYRITRFRQP